MPFDPNQPAENSPLSSAVMRSQLTSLNALIAAIPAGPPGPQGPQGPQGPEGEVTQAEMDAALSTTSSNSNAVAQLGESADSMYNQPQMQNLINKVDELILALRRP